MEIKVIIDVSEDLKQILKGIFQSVSFAKNTSCVQQVKTKQDDVGNWTTSDVKDLEVKETKIDEPIDYENLRIEIRKLGADKRAEGKDVVSLIKKYGDGKLKDVKDENLIQLKSELEKL